MTKSKKQGKSIADRLRDNITRRAAKAVSSIPAPWEENWVCLTHQNLADGRQYTGIDLLLLMAAAHERGFTNPFWLTRGQAKELGGRIIKGEKGVKVISGEKPCGKSMDEDDYVEALAGWACGDIESVILFNADQAEGLDKDLGDCQLPKVSSTISPVPEADLVIKANGIEARYGGKILLRRKYHSHYADWLEVEHPSLFSGWDKYYSRVFCMLADDGMRSYCIDDIFGHYGAWRVQQLILELVSGFLCSRLGMQALVTENLDWRREDWAEAISEDSKSIMVIAELAWSVAERIFRKSPRQDRQSAENLKG